MNLLDIAIVLIILGGAYVGVKRGFVYGVVDLVVVAISLVVGAYTYKPAAGYLGPQLGVTGVGVDLLSFVIVTVLAQAVLLIVLAQIPYFGVLNRLPEPVARILRLINHVLGVGPGLATAVLIAAVLLVSLSILPLGSKLGSRVDEALDESRLAPTLLDRVYAAAGEAQSRTALDLADFTVTTTVDGEGRRLPFKVSAGLEVESADEEAMLTLVNADRAQHGLDPLLPDPRLTAVARKHSEEMLRLGYFAHVSPVTGSPADRLNADGVPFTVAGENIAYAPTVEIAHNALMNSEGHRANILSPDFKRVGIGIISTPIGAKMFTQEFAA